MAWIFNEYEASICKLITWKTDQAERADFKEFEIIVCNFKLYHMITWQLLTLKNNSQL